MESFFASKRINAILGIGVLAISIGETLKKIVRYPTEGCIENGQGITFNCGKSILNKPWFN